MWMSIRMETLMSFHLCQKFQCMSRCLFNFYDITYLYFREQIDEAIEQLKIKIENENNRLVNLEVSVFSHFSSEFLIMTSHCSC